VQEATNGLQLGRKPTPHGPLASVFDGSLMGLTPDVGAD
jgi:hypothetical protein